MARKKKSNMYLVGVPDGMGKMLNMMSENFQD